MTVTTEALAAPVIRTPDQRLRVFVSSTMGELAEERAVARDAICALRLTPVLFELGARPYPPRALYRAYLEQSDVFIGIYGENYGWIAPDMEISGLEDEFLLSEEKPRLVYVKTPNSTRDVRLQSLLEGMRSAGSLSYKEFSNPEDLRELISNDLAVLLTERFEQGQIQQIGRIDPVAIPDDTRRASLPRPITPIVGRAEEMKAIKSLLPADGTRLLTLTGTGGTGKTRLAIEVLHSLIPSFARIFFVSLASITDHRLVASTIAQALGIKELGDRPPEEILGDFLRDKDALLALDNFEQVVEAAWLVTDLLTSCPMLTILATSRTPLRIRGEREFPVPPLPVPEAHSRVDVDMVAASPAVELFTQRAQSVRDDFRVDEANALDVAEICRTLDGLPLAIELAAARVKLLSPRAMLARLGQPLALLTGGARDLPERQKTMRDTIAWSHGLLEEHGAVLFRRLAVFAGGADLDAVESVCGSDGKVGDVVTELEDLVDKGLVRVVQTSDGRPRFAMLQTIGEFAIERLVESGEEECAQRLHAEFFERLVEQAEPNLTTCGRGPWLSRLETDLDNLRAVLNRSLTGRLPAERGLELMSRTMWFWYLRGRIVEGRQLAETLLGHPLLQARSVNRGKVLMAAGSLAWCQGDFGSARARLTASVETFSEPRDPGRLAFPLTLLGATLASQQDYSASRGAYEEAVRSAREAADQWTEAFASSWLADIHLLTGDLASARALQEQSLDLFGRQGDDWGRAMVLHGLAVTLGYQCEYEPARSMFDESIVLFRRADDGYALARVLSGAAELAVKQRDPDRAAALLDEAVRIWTDMGNETGLLLCLGILARIADLRGQPEEAATLLGAARDPLRTVGSISAAGDMAEHEELVEGLRERLGQAAWESHHNRGASMTLKDAVERALR